MIDRAAFITANDRAVRVGPTVDRAAFAGIRREMQLTHCLWDTQRGDLCTLASFPLIISGSTWTALARWAEALTRETLAIERELCTRPDLVAHLGLPRPLATLFTDRTPTLAAARVMRFDFHPTTHGWRVSEVDTDVPGGYAEASAFTRAMASACSIAAHPAGDPVRALIAALSRRIDAAGVVALTHAPVHLEDHQVTSFLAQSLRADGFRTVFASPGQFTWRSGRAHLETRAYRGRVDAIVRFYQGEWLADLDCSPAWHPLFVDGLTPVCNPGIAIVSESKRLPLVWPSLATSTTQWQQLLPETRAIDDIPRAIDDDWVIKSAFGNTGDTVHLRSAMSTLAWQRCLWRARLRPGRWIAQRRFEIVPVEHEGTAYRPCLGVYTVDGVACGMYARMATGSIVDGMARDVAVLVEDER